MHDVAVGVAWLAAVTNGDLGASRRHAAVLFDLDGTLVDSTEVVERIWTSWATGRGIPPERLAGHHGVPTAQILAGLLPAKEVAAELPGSRRSRWPRRTASGCFPGAADAVVGTLAEVRFGPGATAVAVCPVSPAG